MLAGVACLLGSNSEHSVQCSVTFGFSLHAALLITQRILTSETRLLRPRHLKLSSQSCSLWSCSWRRCAVSMDAESVLELTGSLAAIQACQAAQHVAADVVQVSAACVKDFACVLCGQLCVFVRACWLLHPSQQYGRAAWYVHLSDGFICLFRGQPGKWRSAVDF